MRAKLSKKRALNQKAARERLRAATAEEYKGPARYYRDVESTYPSAVSKGASTSLSTSYIKKVWN